MYLFCYVELRLKFQKAERKRKRKTDWTSTNGELRRICIHQTKKNKYGCLLLVILILVFIDPLNELVFVWESKSFIHFALSALAASRCSIWLLLLARNRLFIIVYCVVISLVMCWFRGESSSPILFSCYKLSLCARFFRLLLLHFFLRVCRFPALAWKCNFIFSANSWQAIDGFRYGCITTFPI